MTSPPPITRINLHTSLLPHLATEISLLQSLKHRSKHQHRTQLFFRNMNEIIRLGRLLALALSSDRHHSTATLSSASTGLGNDKSSRKLQKLVVLYIKALQKAMQSSNQQIKLLHFLPLQTLLIAIYSRLFVICSNVLQSTGGEVGDVLSGVLSSSVHQRSMSGVEERGIGGAVGGVNGGAGAGEVMVDVEGEDLELGEKISRSTPTLVPSSSKPPSIPIQHSSSSSHPSSTPSSDSIPKSNPAKRKVKPPPSSLSKSTPPLPSVPSITNENRTTPLITSNTSRTTTQINPQVPEIAPTPSRDSVPTPIPSSIPKTKHHPTPETQPIPHPPTTTTTFKRPAQPKKISREPPTADLNKPKKKRKKDLMDDIFGF